MLICENGVHIVEHEDELPYELIGSEDIFVDVETKSGDKKKKATNPYHHCWIAGICLTTNRTTKAYYIPVGHYQGRNIAVDKVQDFMNQLIYRAKRWINHNIKFDAHVIDLCLKIDHDHVQLVCTQTLAKIIDSDRKYKGGYSLDILSEHWLGHDISRYEKALKPYLQDNNDYGAIPIDILGEYGGQDVITNKRLWKYIDQMCPDQCRQVWDMEIELTRCLFEMEQTGMLVNKDALQVVQLKTLAKMYEIDERIEKRVGRIIRPHVNDDVYQVLCGQHGLPVLERTPETEKGGGGNPSFNKATLKNYKVVPGAPIDLIDDLIAYRSLHTFESLFLTSFLKYATEDNRVHCSYNQSVATGRMSCKAPNFQQANKAAKELILCDPDYVILDLDYSQIEFRTIVHYIQDQPCIEAYLKDPDTDFHQWVADEVKIHRKPAKTVNFLMGYGGGEDLLVENLVGISELVDPIYQEVMRLVDEGKIQKDMVETTFQYLATARGKEVYDSYHARLPGLKQTSRDAMNAAKARGYVFNLAGRRRHLPAAVAHIAFNTINQSSAADIQKERTIAVWKYCKPRGIKLAASVHDNTVFFVPKELATYQTRLEIAAVMENPAIKLDVPIRTAGGYSEKNWLDAATKEDKIPREEIEAEWKLTGVA